MTSAALKKSINAITFTSDSQAKNLLQAVLTDMKTLRDAAGQVLTNSATYNLASLADGAGATTTVGVNGAQLGDFAFASHGVDLQGITMTAWVSAVDVVSVRFQNETAGTLDLASTTLRVMVVPKVIATAMMGALQGKATYDPASLLDATGATTTVTVTGAALGDLVFVSNGVDVQGILMTGYVSAADTVGVRFQNETAGTIDLASATIEARVVPAASFPTAMGGMLFGSAKYDAPSLVDAAGTTTTVTVQGAQMGDYAFVGHGVDLQGITMTAYVSAENTVSMRLQNESGGTLDLVSTTLKAYVLPQSQTSVIAPLSLVK